MINYVCMQLYVKPIEVHWQDFYLANNFYQIKVFFWLEFLRCCEVKRVRSITNMADFS